MEYIILAGAAWDLIQKLIPQIRDQINSGELTDEQAAKAKEDYAFYRKLGGAKYSGSEYELSGR